MHDFSWGTTALYCKALEKAFYVSHLPHTAISTHHFRVCWVPCCFLFLYIAMLLLSLNNLLSSHQFSSLEYSPTILLCSVFPSRVFRGQTPVCKGENEGNKGCLSSTRVTVTLSSRLSASVYLPSLTVTANKRSCQLLKSYQPGWFRMVSYWVLVCIFPDHENGHLFIDRLIILISSVIYPLPILFFWVLKLPIYKLLTCPLRSGMLTSVLSTS